MEVDEQSLFVSFFFLPIDLVCSLHLYSIDIRFRFSLFLSLFSSWVYLPNYSFSEFIIITIVYIYISIFFFSLDTAPIFSFFFSRLLSSLFFFFLFQDGAKKTGCESRLDRVGPLAEERFRNLLVASPELLRVGRRKGSIYLSTYTYRQVRLLVRVRLRVAWGHLPLLPIVGSPLTRLLAFSLPSPLLRHFSLFLVLFEQREKKNKYTFQLRLEL